MKAILILFLILPVVLADWSNENTEVTSHALERFLPDDVGYRWSYWGFAEYGHWMILDKIEQIEDETVYNISGMVEDMSEGEAHRDFSFKLSYYLSDNALTVVRQPSFTMDNDFIKMDLLRLPLIEGNRWTETVTDENGEQIDLICEIEQIDDGLITVRYSQTDSPFYQLRVFEEGIGVVAFEKLYISQDGNFEVGYTLFRDNY